MKTSTKRKVISKKEVTQKKKDLLKSINEQYDKQWADMPDCENTVVENPLPLLRTTKTPEELERHFRDKDIYDSGYRAGVLEGGAIREMELFPDAEATVAQIKSWDEVNESISLTNTITLVLTLVNVAIVVYLTIKNIYG